MTDIARVVLFFGPYRNLTTLTAGLLALHPECQVLNHGKQHVFPEPGDNFLLSNDPATFDRFLARALDLSQRGARGDTGGSITHSHAFDHPAMRDAYRARFGDAVSKPGVRCLVWKESQRTSNALKKHRVDIAALLERLPALRFLTPIRHPLDCAHSNRKTGHYELLNSRRDDSIEAITDAILDELAWFLALEADHPDRFFHFFQDGVDRDTLTRAAGFLGVNADPRWLDDALACYALTPGYEHPEALRTHYRASVRERLAAFPTARDRLLDRA